MDHFVSERKQGLNQKNSKMAGLEVENLNRLMHPIFSVKLNNPYFPDAPKPLKIND